MTNTQTTPTEPNGETRDAYIESLFGAILAQLTPEQANQSTISMHEAFGLARRCIEAERRSSPTDPAEGWTGAQGELIRDKFYRAFHKTRLTKEVSISVTVDEYNWLMERLPLKQR